MSSPLKLCVSISSFTHFINLFNLSLYLYIEYFEFYCHRKSVSLFVSDGNKNIFPSALYSNSKHLIEAIAIFKHQMASDIGGRDPLSRQNALRPYYHRPELVFHDGVPGLEVSKYGGGAPRLSYGAASRADSPLADLDYADYFEFPNTTEVMRTVTSAMLMRYTSTLFAQPFEVAKMILQCGKYERPGSPAGGTKKQIAKGDKPARRSRIDDIDTFEVDIEEQDDEEVDYFSTAGESRKVAKPRHQQNHTRTNSVTSSASSEESNSGSGGRRKPYGRSGLRNTSSPIPEIYQISTHRPHLLGAMGALWTKDGPWGVWKGMQIPSCITNNKLLINASRIEYFVYSKPSGRYN